MDALVVVGGDGTVHLGLDVVATTDVPLGIIAVGTGNDIARHLRLPSRDVAAAARIIDSALRGVGRIARLDAIHATRPDGSPTPDAHTWSLAVVSAGLDAAVTARAVHLERSRTLTIEALPPRAGLRTPPHPMADGEAIAGLPLRLEAVRNVVSVLLPG